ncbi:Chaperone protein dnak [Thalictrum thalictroides]|uniref:Chaperone protein dnak n=1 Tax=Thalictrum thalictroides TaxID=46969 RepID=A0A7J6UYF2_THATH|nr:Chaperone protein dnak [Thalictrum thalictroides]
MRRCDLVSSLLSFRSLTPSRCGIQNASFCSSSNSVGNNHFAINLGTTNSYLAVMGEGDTSPKFIQKVPSVIHLKADSHPINTIYGFKRLIGRRFDDPIILKEMEREVSLPYKIVKPPNGYDAWVETSYGHLCSPIKMLHGFSVRMKETAQSYLGHDSEISGFVYTFPAKFSVLEVKAMMEAGKMAGLNQGNFIYEFSAAAISYGLHKKEEGFLFAVVDLGGRTLDVSILERRLLYATGFKLKGPPLCDMFLGGEDFDNALVDYFVSEASNGLTTAKDIPLSSLQRLRRVAEQAKLQLSFTFETEVNVPSISRSDAPDGTVRDLHLTITRSKFESLVKNLIERIKHHCQKCLKDAGITSSDIDEVILVGGMARVPIVEKVVTEIFGKSPSKGEVDPDKAVVLGAAYAAVHRECLGLHMRSSDVEKTF